jgi:hypothetical protein
LQINRTKIEAGLKVAGKTGLKTVPLTLKGCQQIGLKKILEQKFWNKVNCGAS